MNKETMTVHEALCELKMLDKRIPAAIEKSIPVTAKEHSATTIDGKSVSDWITSAKSAHQSAMDLINRMVAIKSAVNKYNAEKHITVDGKDYTVAQAIWMMQHGMECKQALLSEYSNCLQKTSREIAKANGDSLNARAEAAMTAILGSKDKVDPAVYLKGLQDYKEQHRKELVDPIGIDAVLQKLDNEISGFNAKVDSAIQVANATTMIEIEY